MELREDCNRMAPFGSGGRAAPCSVSSNAQHEGRTIGTAFANTYALASEEFPPSKCTW